MNNSIPLYFDQENSQVKKDSRLKIISWNIQSPSKERAIKQIQYLNESKSDILVLTEIKFGKTFDFYKYKLSELGYDIHHSNNINSHDYVTIIATKGVKSSISTYRDISESEPRALLVDVYFKLGSITILGIYMPSFHPKFSSQDQISRKNSFNIKIHEMLNSYFSGPSNRLVLTGDLNVLEPKLDSSICNGFEMWEDVYNQLISFGMFDCFRKFHSNTKVSSWVSTDLEGFRFDHFLCDLRMKHSVRGCYYDHTVRFNKLSDHSAMYLEVF
ncbi:hypothetical protein L5164_003784 [Vibrio parahaemolyticus]|nr:hypothetical protein [Vibrio parahaemolyticus]